MLRHLEYVLSLLAGEGIPAIALKGPLLAQRYYTPAFLRKPSMDLDLAVIEQDLAGACNVLMKAGYKLDAPISEAIARSHHVTLSHPSRPRVELHFRLSHMTLGIPVDQFFERTVSCRLPMDRKHGSSARPISFCIWCCTWPTRVLAHCFTFTKSGGRAGAEPPDVRAEAVERAVDHHFCGVLRMTDIAFRARLE